MSNEQDQGQNVYLSTKTFTHEVGLSCAFRQWKAESHCKYLHGYALSFKFTFATMQLDERNWVVDFGGLKNLKGWLELTFDHTTLVAEDDPHMGVFRSMNDCGIIQMREAPATGCEKFAEMVYEYTEQWLKDAGFGPRCKLLSVEAREHGANSAIFTKTNIADVGMWSNK